MVRDLHYFLRDYKVIVAVDAHELFDYCFPINPLDQTQKIEAESVAESQAALHYLFKAGESDRPPVILLPEYQEELQRLRNAVYQRADDAYVVAEMIQTMIKAGDLRSATKQQRADLESVVQKSFQFLLTILLGLHSFGVKRMDETYDNGLTSLEDAIEPQDRANFRQILDGYTRTFLYDKIFNELEKENKSDDAEERERTRRANHFDAISIDRLIYLNSEADDNARGGFLTHKYLFLYVSTTSKSEKIFKKILDQIDLPEIRRRRYSFWRDRHQVLAYLIYRRDGETAQQRAEKTVEALMSLHTLLERVNKFEHLITDESNDCMECVLDGKRPTSCDLETYCQDILSISNQIKEKREEVINWGLFKDINSYVNLVDAKVQIIGYEVFMLLFEELLNSRRLKDIALERMYQTHNWISRATEQMLLIHPHKDKLTQMKDRDMRSEKDRVRGVFQYLPSRPRFRSLRYREIVNLIIEFFHQPARKTLVETVYNKFTAIQPEPGEEDEYDLLKCYLYLALDSMEEKTHSAIKETLLTKRDKEEADDDIWRESLYILCWSARRSGHYEEADNYAREGISQYPDDPRYYHGRALNIYTWRALGDNCPYLIAEAAEASERALELYRRPELDSADQVAACYNNSAYFIAIDVKESDSHDRAELTRKLERAREHLTNLKTAIDKEKDWDPTHPEFFHTEAFLEYQEVKNFWMKQEMDKEGLTAKLRSAKRDIETAISIYDCPKYRELRNDIDDFYKRIVSGAIK